MVALTASVTALIAAAALLSGCGSGGDDAPDDTSTTGAAKTQATHRAAAADGARGQRDTTEVAPEDLANFSCRQGKKGRWSASGDLVNSGKKPVEYVVTVVTVNEAGTVVGEHKDTVEVGADDAGSFDWSSFYTGAADQCLPHVTRRPA